MFLSIVVCLSQGNLKAAIQLKCFISAPFLVTTLSPLFPSANQIQNTKKKNSKICHKNTEIS